LAPLNGLPYAKLPPRTKRTLDRASLSAIVLLKESRAALRDSHTNRVLELRKFVFERLNTGGKQLNAQEIRNAIYSGRFNDLIVELTRNILFTRICGIPPYSPQYAETDYESPERKKNSLYKTMGDCQIVLRFFALRREDEIKGSMRSILDHCMERNLNLSEQNAAQYALEYVERLNLADELFGSDTFKLAPKPDERPSESMYDAVMIALDRLWEHRNQLLLGKERIQNAYWAELDTPEKLERFSGRANTAADIRTRIASMTALFEAAISDA
jgi:hypothetical protein